MEISIDYERFTTINTWPLKNLEEKHEKTKIHYIPEVIPLYIINLNDCFTGFNIKKSEFYEPLSL